MDVKVWYSRCSYLPCQYFWLLMLWAPWTTISSDRMVPTFCLSPFEQHIGRPEREKGRCWLPYSSILYPPVLLLRPALVVYHVGWSLETWGTATAHRHPYILEGALPAREVVIVHSLSPRALLVTWDDKRDARRDWIDYDDLWLVLPGCLGSHRAFLKVRSLFFVRAQGLNLFGRRFVRQWCTLKSRTSLTNNIYMETTTVIVLCIWASLDHYIDIKGYPVTPTI